VSDLSKQYSNFPETYVKRSMEQVKFTKYSAEFKINPVIFLFRFIGKHHEESHNTYPEQLSEKSSVSQ
jgi:hypothetical protein